MHTQFTAQHSLSEVLSLVAGSRSGPVEIAQALGFEIFEEESRYLTVLTDGEIIVYARGSAAWETRRRQWLGLAVAILTREGASPTVASARMFAAMLALLSVKRLSVC